MLQKNELSSRFKKLDTNKTKEIKPLKIITDSNANVNANTENEIEISEGFQTEIQDELSSALLEKIEKTPVWFEYSKNRKRELVKNFIENKITSENLQISDLDKEVLTDNLISSVSNFGAVQYLLDNDKVSKVVICGTKNVLIEIDNKILNTETKLSDKQLTYILNNISSLGIENYIGIKCCKTEKYLITVISPDICEDGYNISIKKIKESNKETLIKNKILSNDIFNLIISLVEKGKNIVLSGCVNSCKTALLEAIIKELSASKRCSLVENSKEISYSTENLTKYQADINSKDFTDVVSYVQKNGSDYIFSDFNVFNTKISAKNYFVQTVQAKSIEDSLRQIICTYIRDGYDEKSAKIQALSDINYIVFLDITDNSPKVVEIAELTPAKTMQLSVKAIAVFENGKYDVNIQNKRLKTSQS